MSDEIRTWIRVEARNDQLDDARGLFRALNAKFGSDSPAVGPMEVNRPEAGSTYFSQSLTGDVGAAVREHLDEQGNPLGATVEVWINDEPVDDRG
ncbi:hypothetical protein [Streptomyces sp. NPDC016845]|uniref:hypothetical protein n=1 Tax=Streptomyces sp. NPDC016845 TaxID=3364972 RepID=UPI0037ADBF7E